MKKANKMRLRQFTTKQVEYLRALSHEENSSLTVFRESRVATLTTESEMMVFYSVGNEPLMQIQLKDFGDDTNRLLTIMDKLG